jgi:hypothetical protein
MSAANRRSKNITEGVARAPNRSMYYGMGYHRERLRQADDRRGQRSQHHHALQLGPAKLADAAVEGLEAAGANAQLFGTPTISDGMAMGTEGMKYSLVSREVIADCVETCVGGQWMDGVHRHRRLRQEHARRHDGHAARQRAFASTSTAAPSCPASTRVRTSTSSACSRPWASSAPAR